MMLGLIAIGGCRGTSFGVVLGEPTGLSMTMRTDDGQELAAALGFGFVDGDGMQGHLDWLWYVDTPESGFTAYWGLGGRLRLREDESRSDDDKDSTDLGIRVPLGLRYDLTGRAAHVFFEVAPGLDVINPKWTFDGGIGIRFEY
jgi:hypothetical protein